MSKTVIIGGGIIGLSIAWELHKRGENVLVLDARTAGTAASAANAGYMVMTHTGPVPTPGLVRTSLKWMLNPESPLYIKPRLSPAFLSWLYRFWRACNSTAYEAGAEATMLLRGDLPALLQEWVDDGIDFELHKAGRIHAYNIQSSMESDLSGWEGTEYHQPQPLYGDDLRHFEPALSDEIVAGFHIEEDYAVQPNSLVNGLIAKLRSAGVEVRQGSPVVDLEVSQKRIVAVRTPSERIPADHVVIAAGAWSGAISKMAGVRLPIEGGKGYGLDYKSVTEKPKRAISLKNHQIAVSPFDEGLRLGGTMELSGISDAMAPRRIAAIERGGKRSLRGLPEDAKPDHIWTGMRPMAPDGLPVMGRLRGFNNLSVASGHSMLGVTLAPATAKLMADFVITGYEPELMKSFSPDRFKGRI